MDAKSIEIKKVEAAGSVVRTVGDCIFIADCYRSWDTEGRMYGIANQGDLYARRLAACWNFFTGPVGEKISTESIEKGTIENAQSGVIDYLYAAIKNIQVNAMDYFNRGRDEEEDPAGYLGDILRTADIAVKGRPIV